MSIHRFFFTIRRLFTIYCKIKFFHLFFALFMSMILKMNSCLATLSQRKFKILTSLYFYMQLYFIKICWWFTKTVNIFYLNTLLFLLLLWQKPKKKCCFEKWGKLQTNEHWSYNGLLLDVVDSFLTLVLYLSINGNS